MSKPGMFKSRGEILVMVVIGLITIACFLTIGAWVLSLVSDLLS